MSKEKRERNRSTSTLFVCPGIRRCVAGGVPQAQGYRSAEVAGCRRQSGRVRSQQCGDRRGVHTTLIRSCVPIGEWSVVGVTVRCASRQYVSPPAPATATPNANAACSVRVQFFAVPNFINARFARFSNVQRFYCQ